MWRQNVCRTVSFSYLEPTKPFEVVTHLLTLWNRTKKNNVMYNVIGLNVAPECRNIPILLSTY